MIYPSTLDEDGKQIKDFKVKLWEVLDIANDVKITVAKDQKSWNVIANAVAVEYSDTLVFPPVVDMMIEGATYTANGSKWAAIAEATDSRVLVMDVSDLSKVKAVLTTDTAITVYFVDAIGMAVSNTTLAAAKTTSVDIPTGAAFAILSLAEDAEIVLTEYLPR